MSQTSDRLQTVQDAFADITAREALDAAVACARLEMRAVLTARIPEEAEAALAEEAFAASLLARLALADELPIATAAAELASIFDRGRMTAVALAAIGHPVLVAAPQASALAAHARLLLALGGGDSVAFWQPAGAEMAPILQVGAEPPAGAAALARRALSAGATATSRDLAAVPVNAHDAPAAVLLWHAVDVATSLVLAERAALAAAPAFQHALAVTRNQEGFDAIVQAPERRLRRLALDLHDGALQDVALIAGELRRLEDDLRPIVADTEHAEQIRGSLEALAALVDALETDLREVATSVEGLGMLRRPFAEAIESIVRVFRARTPIAISVDVSGDAGLITDSQRIAIFRVVQEALTNVGKHSRAASVSVSVRIDESGTVAEIRDDGIGFDAERALEAAAGRERIGLLGMVERVRLLGGECTIESRRGEGVAIRVLMPRYLMPEAEAATPR